MSHSKLTRKEPFSIFICARDVFFHAVTGSQREKTRHDVHIKLNDVFYIHNVANRQVSGHPCRDVLFNRVTEVLPVIIQRNSSCRKHITDSRKPKEEHTSQDTETT